jgi:hypothetical protein
MTKYYKIAVPEPTGRRAKVQWHRENPKMPMTPLDYSIWLTLGRVGWTIVVLTVATVILLLVLGITGH